MNYIILMYNSGHRNTTKSNLRLCRVFGEIFTIRSA